ncbi:hypothetical protein PFICI_05991 [Pestalotiopsis fici W106-1]|uniref:Uncharacterized protein n=1 Tax=Pestalotiopsis fici (strain W106-1 / CGMCC3.15140) TaxID=1229662 RepID=W3X4Q5_PESFW|nr:uncharacterized protein PFICI_05991 [Pestalotiopsis fici W106-1]ETS80989.1 hypothetical protein PFICI_05991 [Pestalotiopsis fici W106-1]
MFDNFTFHQVEEVHRTRHHVDDANKSEPHLSPNNDYDPVDWFSPQATPATTKYRPTEEDSSSQHGSSNSDSGSGSTGIDHIVRQMSRQTLLPYVRSNGQVRAVSHMEDVSTEWPSLDDDPISSFAMPFRRTQLQVPRAALRNMYRATPQTPDAPAQETTSPAEHAAAEVASDASRSPAHHQFLPQPETPAEPTSSNPRAIREALVESMIAHGVQCNVQSNPLPAASTDPGVLVGGKVQAKADQPMLDAGAVQGLSDSLEVGDPLADNEELAFMCKLASLRQAGKPSGIRRANGLNYRSSAEAAAHLSKRGLVRNKLKMRRRDKSKPTDPIDPKQMLTPPPEEDTAMPIVG